MELPRARHPSSGRAATGGKLRPHKSFSSTHPLHFAVTAYNCRRPGRLCNSDGAGGRSKCKADRILVNRREKKAVFAERALETMTDDMCWSYATTSGPAPSHPSHAVWMMTTRVTPLALTSNYTDIDVVGDAITMEASDVEEEYTPYNERPETYFVPIILLLIMLIGLTGNGVLAFTILRHSSMRNVPNTYVLSLALGDLLARNVWPYSPSLSRRYRTRDERPPTRAARELLSIMRTYQYTRRR